MIQPYAVQIKKRKKEASMRMIDPETCGFEIAK